MSDIAYKIFNNPDEKIQSVLDAPLKSRTKKILLRKGIEDIGEVRKFTEREILSWKGVGPATVLDIRMALHAKGYDLSDKAAYPFNLICRLFDGRTFKYLPKIEFRFDKMVKLHLRDDEIKVLEDRWKYNKKLDIAAWGRHSNAMRKLRKKYILEYITSAKVTNDSCTGESITFRDIRAPRPKRHSCASCRNHYREDGLRGIWCKLDNKYVSCQTAENFNCHDYIKIDEYEKEWRG